MAVVHYILYPHHFGAERIVAVNKNIEQLSWYSTAIKLCWRFFTQHSHEAVVRHVVLHFQSDPVTDSVRCTTVDTAWGSKMNASLTLMVY